MRRRRVEPAQRGGGAGRSRLAARAVALGVVAVGAVGAVGLTGCALREAAPEAPPAFGSTDAARPTPVATGTPDPTAVTDPADTTDLTRLLEDAEGIMTGVEQEIDDDDAAA